LDLDYEKKLVRANREETRRKLGLTNHHVFIFVGRMSRWKGVNEAAAAFSKLRQKRNDVAFLFVGDGPRLEPLKRKFSNIPDMHFLGYRKDVGTWMNAADSIVLPSYREGLPTVLLEGMYSRLPFLATDVGGVRDLIRLGAKGHMIPRPDTDFVYQGLRKLANTNSSLLKSYGDNNRRIVKEKFSWESLLPQLLDVYDSAREHAEPRRRWI
jgi:glycosyltransferase involved in cell wall biosynthesis